MRAGFSLIAILTFAGSSTAAAQSPIDLGMSRSPAFDWTNDTATNDDFGRCSQSDQRYAERAIRSCGRIIGERASSDITAASYYFRGLMYATLHNVDRAQSDFENAYTYFTIAAGSRRHDADAYANRAAALYRLERYDEALADYERALAETDSAASEAGTRVRSAVADRRAGQIAGLHYQLGRVYFRMRNWRESILEYDAPAALAPDTSLYQAARCEARAAAAIEIDIARTACEEAIRLGDDENDPRFSRGFLRLIQGELSDALDDFSGVYADDDQALMSLYGRGVTARHLGRTEEGDADIAQATQALDPDSVAKYARAGLQP